MLLGFNAAGKSNFLDILHFVSDAVEMGPVEAVTRRGGIEALLHRSPGHEARSFEIHLDLLVHLPGQAEATEASYRFVMASDPSGDTPVLVAEEFGGIRLLAGLVDLQLAGQRRRSRLGLTTSAAGDADALESALRSMRFYDLDTEVLRALDEQPPRVPLLGPRGEHLGRVLGELAEDAVGKERFDAYLEEPETALHPANVNALYEAMDDAAQHVQVIVTSQSSDLLDSEYAHADHVLAVANTDGVTTVGPIDEAGRTSSTGAS